MNFVFLEEIAHQVTKTAIPAESTKSARVTTACDKICLCGDWLWPKICSCGY